MTEHRARGIVLSRNHGRTNITTDSTKCFEQNSEPDSGYKLLAKLFKHQVWLTSNGRFGERLDEPEINFLGANLDGVDFRQARIPDASFDNASLRYANFAEADLTGTDLRCCLVEGANFAGANLSKACFKGTKYQEAASFEGANTEDTEWTTDMVEDAAIDYETYQQRVLSRARLPDREP